MRLHLHCSIGPEVEASMRTGVSPSSCLGTTTSVVTFLLFIYVPGALVRRSLQAPILIRLLLSLMTGYPY